MVTKETMIIGISSDKIANLAAYISAMESDGRIDPLDAQRLEEFLHELDVQVVPAAPDKHVEANREALLQRSKAGLAKYGTTTERKDLGFDDWCQHALEEALDLANYLQAARAWFPKSAEAIQKNHLLTEALLAARIRLKALVDIFPQLNSDLHKSIMQQIDEALA